MTDFKAGDRVRLSAEAGFSRQAALGDAEGVVLDDPNPYHKGVLVDWDGHDDTWNSPHPDEIELVQPQYDEATKDAIVAHLRAKGFAHAPNEVERTWDELTAPKTHEVVQR